jgi:uncharacterized protein YndB with AHSA1/START domain
MATGTVRLHRVFTAPAERIYRAFVDPAAVAKWYAPHGFTCSVYAMNPVVGGRFHMAFTNFSGGGSHSFGGEYLELVPNERLVFTDRFDDPGPPGEMRTSVTLSTVSCGTELTIVQEGIPDAIPPEMCYLGWQETLRQLTQLVEPNIPAGT